MTASSPPDRLLTVADLDSHGEWLVVDAGPSLERAYREVTGWAGEQAPAGLASVVARRAYTRGLAMPPGGVLREIRQTLLGPPPSDGRYRVQVAAAVVGERSGRRRVEVDAEVASAVGDPVAQVGFSLDWPAGAE
ncbi:hypothetical protein [Angustibacter sp. Root456]|uniref:hypothetical protein n=1 Tax=Angustibacter sp. Root456 TaxID=1736539 RepID=UPI0006FDC532|nr:hypothetical protein [Angustibacter sp. Root456]KQX62815.1 hypothetical protein ASD06_12395 [Angustibacter sp. Root456]